MNISKEQYEQALKIIKEYEKNTYHLEKNCCVCKNAVVKTLYPISKNEFENAMWDSGIVSIIQAGYGSSHDMDSFIIAICDSCIEILTNSNIIEKVNGKS